MNRKVTLLTRMGCPQRGHVRSNKRVDWPYCWGEVVVEAKVEEVKKFSAL